VLLTLLAVLIAGLAVSAAIAGRLPAGALTAVVFAVCGGVVAISALATASGGTSTLTLPFGPAGTATHLALDPLAASFLLLLFATTPCKAAAPLPLAALGLTLLSGDCFTLATGLLLLGVPDRLRVAAGASVCVIVALAFTGASADFALLRAAQSTDWFFHALPFLLLLAAGGISRVCPAIGLYLLIRVLLGLGSADEPLWWGLPLLLAGAAVASFGALRAALAGTIDAVASACPLQQFGLAVMAIGVAVMARAVDLPSVVSQALAAAWLAAVGHVLGRALLSRVAQAVEAGAGTRRLDRLGGLVHGMPVTAAACLAALVVVAALPPGLGFAAFWLLLQLLLSVARSGDAGFLLLLACIAAVTAGSIGVMALAAVRLFGIVFLGRPRTPRAAAADEPASRDWLVVGGLATVATLLGVMPGLALLPAGGWTKPADALSFLVVRTGPGVPGYSPLAVAVLLGVLVLPILHLCRPSDQHREPVWSGGFAAPAWLPFGDPATQYGPASFVAPLKRIVGLLAPLSALRDRARRYGGLVMRMANRLMTP
jgi:formate hydrogenlyase subunit 3/multisubunit Na+/H+ antiporter MnhD subunit